MRTTMICLCVALAVTASMALRQESAARAAQISKASSADIADGKLVYDQKCEACHFSASSEKKIGPGLAGLMKWPKFKNGMTADEDHLRRVIERGGKDMPGFRDSLKEKQIRDLIAYVKTL
jgi:mono/diheme cytochrome c family protein